MLSAMVRNNGLYQTWMPVRLMHCDNVLGGFLIYWYQHVSNHEVRRITEQPPLTSIIQRRRWPDAVQPLGKNG